MFKKRSEKGQSLVEVTLTLPIILLLVMGILDLGRAYFTYIALSDAAAEGAAYAAIHPTDTAQIIARATDSSDGLVVVDPEMVNVNWSELTAGSPVTVVIEYDYQILTPIVNSFVDEGKITMRATSSQPIIDDGL